MQASLAVAISPTPCCETAMHPDVRLCTYIQRMVVVRLLLDPVSSAKSRVPVRSLTAMPLDPPGSRLLLIPDPIAHAQPREILSRTNRPTLRVWASRARPVTSACHFGLTLAPSPSRR